MSTKGELIVLAAFDPRQVDTEAGKARGKDDGRPVLRRRRVEQGS
ncbi:MAG TPA: hypothetical protein VGO22_03570 [Pseudorhizobium sp.]|jgi:hypothetical protein|nr:hypothetical protein [Pseudorhizobium sp.]